jgi:hypothetical protein
MWTTSCTELRRRSRAVRRSIQPSLRQRSTVWVPDMRLSTSTSTWPTSCTSCNAVRTPPRRSRRRVLTPRMTLSRRAASSLRRRFEPWSATESSPTRCFLSPSSTSPNQAARSVRAIVASGFATDYGSMPASLRANLHRDPNRPHHRRPRRGHRRLPLSRTRPRPGRRQPRLDAPPGTQLAAKGGSELAGGHLGVPRCPPAPVPPLPRRFDGKLDWLGDAVSGFVDASWRTDRCRRGGNGLGVLGEFLAVVVDGDPLWFRLFGFAKMDREDALAVVGVDVVGANVRLQREAAHELA